MKEEIILREKIKLLEKELGTLTDMVEKLRKDLKEMDDLRSAIKGLKLFLGRVHAEFKTRFPEIMQKVYKKK